MIEHCKLHVNMTRLFYDFTNSPSERLNITSIRTDMPPLIAAPQVEAPYP